LKPVSSAYTKSLSQNISLDIKQLAHMSYLRSASTIMKMTLSNGGGAETCCARSRLLTSNAGGLEIGGRPRKKPTMNKITPTGKSRFATTSERCCRKRAIMKDAWYKSKYRERSLLDNVGRDRKHQCQDQKGPLKILRTQDLRAMALTMNAGSPNAHNVAMVAGRLWRPPKLSV
jgi:hypothetical protein